MKPLSLLLEPEREGGRERGGRDNGREEGGRGGRGRTEEEE